MRKFLLTYLLLIGTLISAQITLGSGTTSGGVSTSVATVPWSTYYGYSYAQQIITKADINASASGNITGLKFYLAASQVITNSNQIVVYLGLTNKATFTSTSDWIPTTALTQVFSGTATNNAGVVEITFPTPFPYDNINNLVIAVDENKSGDDGGEYFYTYPNGDNKTIYYRSDGTNPDPAAITQTGTRSTTQSVVTLLGLSPSSVPNCPVVTAPSAAATGVAALPTISWAAVSGATGYRLSVGTTAGGTDIVNNQDLGNVTSYVFSTTLQYNKQYFYTVKSYNGAIPSVNCSERSFTTMNIPCPAVSLPAADATGVALTPTITWAAVTGATGYKLSVGTTAGGTNVLNNQNVGNVLTYTFTTPLNPSTKYYYTVNSNDATNTSSSCSERNFTTLCNTENAPTVSQSFASYLPVCWSAAKGAVSASSTLTYGTSKWASESGFANTGTNAAVRINLYSDNPGDWLISQPINLGNTSGIYRVKYRMAVTDYLGTTAQATLATHIVRLIVSTDGGTTWSNANVIKTYTGAGTYSNTGQTEIVNLTGYTGTVKFAFVATTASTSPDIDFHVDDFVVEAIPSCEAPLNPSVSLITQQSATLSWTATTVAPANGYQYYYSTTNTPPTSGTPTTAVSVPLSPLAPSTTYYYWVRSMCAGSESAWVSGSFTTLAAPPANDACSSPAVLTPGATYAQNILTGTTIGATNTPALSASCLFTPTNVGGNVWYSVVVPASGNLTIETGPVTGSALTDTVVSVFANCSSTTSLYCDDDNGVDAFSKIEMTGQTPGATLLVSVWIFGNTSTTNGQFRISAYDASLATSEATPVKNNLSVYPNPFADVLNVSNVKNVKTVSILDIAGRLVKTVEKPSSALQLGDLKSGMYVIVLNMNDGSKQTIKAIKK
ncbi:T9SS type A sorting domain-containing protein [Chryseobacterium sp. PBS4-4]|uniref:T9SS type A sorting domain-containing protein n=1 Tax=Chryseobacterium edaphi TaxID=2976532 RepID=A0ABT2W1X2_9FLAO|nr:T9SS type A sorting domain-containing protein [Chryseobacterium edaphi]MCU7615923.1 T9SS type A sorting domain-containing protein [Chryseobacterium edaphi]